MNLQKVFLHVTKNLTLSRYESKFAEVVRSVPYILLMMYVWLNVVYNLFENEISSTQIRNSCNMYLNLNSRH